MLGTGLDGYKIDLMTFLFNLIKFVVSLKKKLDRGSIRSSPRYDLRTAYGLTNRNSAELFHHVLIYMGDLHLVLPALNLSTPDFDNSATRKTSFLSLST